MFSLPALLIICLSCVFWSQSVTAGNTELEFESLEERASSNPQCTTLCKVLIKKLGADKVVLPNSTAYASEGSSYWSAQQAEQTPYCYVTPTSANDVSEAVVSAFQYHCPFASRSGGHAAFYGASNTNKGFTMDLRQLNEITVSADQKITSVGPGNRWIDVYQALEPKSLAVIGGRVAGIGTGGLTLGGGISFLSGRHGWACDNVQNYEIVIANGSILDVNYTSYPDLYYALRGGGNNFGVVTRFDYDTFQQGAMWGGSVIYNYTLNASVTKALYYYAHAAPSDPDAAVYCAFAFSSEGFIISNEYTYIKPVVNPPIFHNFTSNPNITSTTRITTLPDLTLELQQDNPSGNRETYTTATFVMDDDLMQDILKYFEEETVLLAEYLPNLVMAVVLQAITADEVKHFSKRGGNALGIDVSETPLLLLNVDYMWTSTDDRVFLNSAYRIVKRARRAARKRGLNVDYLYQNYASHHQKVLPSYGEENFNKLVTVSHKYDPEGLFQKFVPGYFKLTGRTASKEEE